MNPNDTVRVKLTLHGKELIIAHINALNDKQKRGSGSTRYVVPPWDGSGWIEGQFHLLMSYFGDCWYAGAELPFTELEKVP